MSTKVLLADDSMTAQNIGKKILTDAGFDVVAVSNGAQALKKIPEHAPDIVILDVYMPGYSGLEVCEKLRNAEFTAKIPVVLTVGKMEPYRAEDGERVKADGVIIKPFEASDLIAVVSKLVESVAPLAPVVEEAPVAPVAPPAPVDIQYDTESILSQDFGDVAVPARPFAQTEVPANSAAFSPEDLLDLGADVPSNSAEEPFGATPLHNMDVLEDAQDTPMAQFGSMHIAVPDALAAAAELTVSKEEASVSIPMLEMTKEDEPFFAAPAFDDEPAESSHLTAASASFSSEMSPSVPAFAAIAPEPTSVMDSEPMMEAPLAVTPERDSNHDFLLHLNSFLPDRSDVASTPGHEDEHVPELAMFAEQSVSLNAEQARGEMEPVALETEVAELAATSEEPVAMQSYISAMGTAPAMLPPAPAETHAAEMAVTSELRIKESFSALELDEPTVTIAQTTPELIEVAVVESETDPPAAQLAEAVLEPETTIEVPEPILKETPLLEISGMPCAIDESRAHAVVAHELAVSTEPEVAGWQGATVMQEVAQPEASRICCSATQPGEPEAHLSATVLTPTDARAQALSPEQMQVISGIVARMVERMLPTVLEQVLAEFDGAPRA